jgi:2-hydroxychromene-2-carboxylate isomerase
MLEQNNIRFRDKPVKMRYTWRDIERRGARYGIPFDRVPTYPVDPDSLANRVGVLAAVEGWCPEYTKATYREHLDAILVTLGKDPESVVSLADSQEIRDRYDSETSVARSMGIFGSPTFAVGRRSPRGSPRVV